MVRGSTKLKVPERPFSTRLFDVGLPVNLDMSVIRESHKGVMKTFWKEQYHFQIAEENTEERERRRLRLKKLRKIAKDLNKVLKIQM